MNTIARRAITRALWPLMVTVVAPLCDVVTALMTCEEA